MSILLSALKPFLMAIAFLTCIPVIRFLPKEWSAQDQGRSTLWYPVVGLLLSFILYGFYCLLPSDTSLFLWAAFLIVLWIGLTGALHLDGLADCADAFFAAHSFHDAEQKKQKILSVLKEPTVGVMAVVSLVLLILLKFALIVELQEHLLTALVLSLVLSRCAALIFIMTTPYAKARGLGSVLHQFTPISWAWITLIIISCLLSIVFSPMLLLVCMAIVSSLIFFWRQWCMHVMQGFVGDTVGALIELTEVLVLVVLYLYF